MQTFVRLRVMLTSNQELAQKVKELERHLAGHDKQIQTIFEAIRQLIIPAKGSRRLIGFKPKDK